MTEREVLQLIGHLNPATFPELYYYYDSQPRQRIKRLVSLMESKNHIVFTCYEKAGFYLTPTGLKRYQDNKRQEFKK